ncbi:unnamed protein product [Schistocephalus solidus]|uniref:Agrin n=1 Tax=Schistocephalus solidus TaxID=70667 RepID=A0A183TST6_SCHSO|nr:unnamed protein product [Schistocephalus solidus]
MRGDLLQTFRMVNGLHFCLEFSVFFQFAAMTQLRGHPLKLRVQQARLDVRSSPSLSEWLNHGMPSLKMGLSSPTLDNLDTFLRFCNHDDGLQVQLMIKAGSDGFAFLIGGLCSQQGRISTMIS